ncbi:class I SAM-dependent methyltransferase [Kitasatospora hibisci]|uniref:class I SAM-dependent methyltransferase n=1 Tax=Kitasatospora hibisci TaxID=3369522 RepID=UPI003754D649
MTRHRSDGPPDGPADAPPGIVDGRPVDAPLLGLAAFYADGDEAGRLTSGRTIGTLELLRTREILRAHLPPPPAAVLDVGGGPGVHARWLTDDGHHVVVVDAVERHVRQARDLGLTATVGDARRLAQGDASFDAVLLLGPLYHLPEAADRVRAWQEALRVVRPGGLVAAAALNRYARLLDPAATAALDVATTGLLHRADGPTSYYHSPAELLDEAGRAGLSEPAVYGVQGPAFTALRTEERHTGARDLGADALEAALAAARFADAHPELVFTSMHLLAVAHRPAEPGPR